MKKLDLFPSLKRNLNSLKSALKGPVSDFDNALCLGIIAPIFNNKDILFICNPFEKA